MSGQNSVFNNNFNSNGEVENLTERSKKKVLNAKVLSPDMEVEDLDELSGGCLSIKEWEPMDRPREKMLSSGSSSLSNAELLAILIGSGNAKESAVNLAQRILKSYDNRLQRLSKAEVRQLTTNFSGIGNAKAITIKAAMELCRRLSVETPEETISVHCSNDIYKVIKPNLYGAKTEQVWVLYLNPACKIIEKRKVSEGGLTGSVVDVRVIMHGALSLLSTGIVLIHNHPSGALNPSMQDKRVTHKLLEAATVCDVKLMDHLIFTDDGFYSFFDEGELI